MMILSNINLQDSKPLFKQIKRAIISAIENQDILPGEKIPSLEDLSRRYGVSRMTVRHAVQELVREGRLYTVIGKGTFVTQNKKIETPMNRIWGFSDSFSIISGNRLSRLISLDVHKAGDEIAEKLRISPDRNVYKLSRLRMLSQKPVAVEIAYLPFDLFPDLQTFDWNKVSLYATLRENYLVKLSRGQQYVEAGCAPQKIAELLEVQTDTPVLIMDRVIISDSGWYVEYAHTYYRADRIRLLVHMSGDEPITLVKAQSLE